MKVVNVLSWCKTAKKGDVVEYYRGYLYTDRKVGPNKSVVNSCGDHAWAAYDKGLVTLYQIRHKSGDYSYMAKKRKK